jgi:hypothetical protein
MLKAIAEGSQLVRFLPLLLLLLPACAGAQSLSVPPRAQDALSGTEIIAALTPLSLEDREERIYHEVLQGNVPDFLRQSVPVSVTRTIQGQSRTATYRVLPDYMALGSDEDHFLCPMSPRLAQWLCDALECSLPTRRMVGDIWATAPAHFSPQPIPPSPAMTTIPVFADHNEMVWTQRSAVLATHPLGTLVGGTKKDVVITPQLPFGSHGPPNRVAIYGWQYLSGTPIQPLYLGHVDWYADYSHGIRLVLNEMTVNGSPTTVQSVLTDPVLHPLLSDEGAFTSPRYDAPDAPMNLDGQSIH